MNIKPIKTKILHPSQDDLFRLLDESIIKFKERDILIVSSKVVSIHQGRCIKKTSDESQKKELVIQEADKYIDLLDTPNRKYSLITLKQGIVIGQSGIDESNGDGYYILWPKNPVQLAEQIYDYLKERFGVQNFGVIITDTRSQPFRLGTMGFSLAHYGFEALKKYSGKKDLFQRGFKSERVNVVDSLATAAGVVIGEGDEQTPLAVISDVEFIKFGRFSDPPVCDLREDQYLGLIRNDLWKK